MVSSTTAVTQPHTTTLSVVIPAYNEEEGIGAIIERVLRARTPVNEAGETIDRWEVLVIDDASEDHTAKIAASYPEVRVIRHDRNRGYGGALKTGFEEARGEYIGFLDADGTYPPEYFPALCQVLFKQRADIVIGSRLSGDSSAMPLPRLVGNKFFAYLLSWISGTKVTDSASGMRVFRKSVLSKLLPLPDGLHLTPAMSTSALHAELRIVEVPIPYEERVGRSKLRVVFDGFRFLDVIVRITRLYNPLKFFGAMALALLAAAFVLGVEPVMHYLRVRRVEDTEIYRLFTIMVLTLTGIQIAVFGALSNYVLELIHGRRLTQPGFIGRYILNRRVIRRSGVIGVALMASAVVLNYRTIIEYVTTGSIYVHWVYILTGAVLFLVGVQLVMGSILIGIIEELKGRGSGFAAHENRHGS